MSVVDPLPSWRPGPAKEAILGFVRSVTEPGDSFVPAPERVATFDNDGTLWCEKPLPIQADFILRRLFEMAEADPGLRDRQPWKAAYERDYGWLGRVLAEHYAGDDTNVRTLLAGVLAAHSGISVEEFEAQSDAFLRTTQHPTLGRPYLACAYAPMVELLGHLEASGFANYIASGGGRDFMRPISQEVYGVPRERVIGSATALDYVSDGRGGTITRKAEADYLDDGPRSRSASGAGPAAGRCSPPATRTATSRCSTSPGIRTSRPFACSCSTTTASASSTTRPARSRRSRRPAATAGPSSASGTTGPRCSDLEPRRVCRRRSSARRRHASIGGGCSPVATITRFQALIPVITTTSWLSSGPAKCRAASAGDLVGNRAETST